MAPRIGFAGMSHLGLVSAVAAAGKGFETVCFDPRGSRIAELEAGRLGIVEPGLDSMFREVRERLSFTHDGSALASCDVVFIAADVATDAEGESDLSEVKALIAGVRSRIAPQCAFVVLSQVPPGFTRSLEVDSAATYYQVETLIFGQALHRALAPERIIVGAADPGRPLADGYRAFLDAFACPVLVMRYESAELAKISINMFLVASVTTTNAIAELCERIGADWYEIAEALRLDRRIGPHAYLTPGLGIAGGNLERDLATFRRLAGASGCDAGIVEAWRGNSRYRKEWPLRVLHHGLDIAPGARVAVWGLAYKKDTGSTRNSPALSFLRAVPHLRVRVFDPAAVLAKSIHPHARQVETPLAACEGAQALFILTPWDVFGEIEPAAIAERLAGKVVVDPYRMLDADAAAAAGLRRIVLGAGRSEG